jgi:hypothetical protein
MAQIESIHNKTHALTVLIPPGTEMHLPSSMLSPSSTSPPIETQPDLKSYPRQAIITSPTQLESAILDIDGRVERIRRPNGNAWKSLVVWRARDDDEGMDGGAGSERGGRENCGTLFYLRGCFYQDQ